jgi:hypothetical protein
MVSIDEGIQIDRSDEQFSNEHPPRVTTAQELSNAKIERSIQLQKQRYGIVSIDEGRQID